MIAGWRKNDNDFGDIEVWEKDWQLDDEDVIKRISIPEHRKAMRENV